MKKFILIDHEPWTLRRKQLFYDLFEKAGIPLFVWDLSQWLYPGLSNPDELTDTDYLTKVYSHAQFVDLLEKEASQDTVIVEEVFRHKWNNRHVFKELSKRNFTTIKIELYGNTILKNRTLNKILSIPISSYPKKIKSKIESSALTIYNKINKIKSPDLTFSSNSVLPLTYHINHPDYEDFKFKEHKQLIDGKYIIFCDIFFPYHSDLKFFHGMKRLPDGEKYHAIMTEYFDFLEHKYKMPVVIAAHPKADYKGHEFGDRKIIKYHTSDLVYYAEAVTMHLCNTTSYVLLADKPVAYIATNDYLSFSDTKRMIDLLATKTLHLPIYNIEDSTFKTTFKFNNVEKEYREDYIYSYLTSKNTEKSPNHEIISEILLKI